MKQGFRVDDSTMNEYFESQIAITHSDGLCSVIGVLPTPPWL